MAINYSFEIVDLNFGMKPYFLMFNKFIAEKLMTLLNSLLS